MGIKNQMAILRGCLKVGRNMLISFWPIIKLFNFIKIGNRHLLSEDIVKSFKVYPKDNSLPKKERDQRREGLLK